MDQSTNSPQEPAWLQLTEQEFKVFATIIKDKARIHLPLQKLTLLSNRLRKRLQALNIPTYAEYLDFIRDPQNRTELSHLLDVISTNETYFFRNLNHWTTFSDHIVPEIRSLRKNETIRLWSAGCSTGEEPYTMVISLLESMKTLGHFKFEILATDLSQTVIDLAQKGSYHERRVSKVDPTILKRYFQKNDQDGLYYLREDLKNYVEFKQANLFRDKHPSNMDIIFCRNVMIYFQREDQKRLVQMFYDSLRDPGYLMIGHSESLHIFDSKFKVKPFDGSSFVYTKDK